jgi:amidase
MPTTGGALAFAGLYPPYESTLTKNLRDAGAIILAKTQMTELANWIASGMPGNYNGLNGHGMNPYDPRRDPRDANFDGRPVLNTGGSSQASAPAASSGRPTSAPRPRDRSSRRRSRTCSWGSSPRWGASAAGASSRSPPTRTPPGPMARTVTDAAILLGAMEGAAPDPNDAATKPARPPPGATTRSSCNAKGLAGARIGIPRAFFYDRLALPGSSNRVAGSTTPSARR